MLQPETGYRFSIDPIILAGQANPFPNDRIADLGTGCGIVSLIISKKHPETRTTGVEIQAALAAIARKNVEENKLTNRVSILLKDIRELMPGDLGGRVDLVVTNPPYIKQGCGRINPDSQRAIARHEVMLTLDQLLAAATRILTAHGRFMIIFPMERLHEVVDKTRLHNLRPSTIRFIHTKKNKPAELFILTAVNNSNPFLTMLPAMFL
ncbi:MAG: methyltransferase [Desulfobacterium sp.]|jgi:tRNA1Val (adenine37-N6)-methyltransferase|nr:methyltransferase [Desulfobacterium sp.]